MGGVPVKHHSKSKVGRRRAHQALKKKIIYFCPSCQGPILPHRTCVQCGKYRTKSSSKSKAQISN